MPGQGGLPFFSVCGRKRAWAAAFSFSVVFTFFSFSSGHSSVIASGSVEGGLAMIAFFEDSPFLTVTGRPKIRRITKRIRQPFAAVLVGPPAVRIPSPNLPPPFFLFFPFSIHHRNRKNNCERRDGQSSFFFPPTGPFSPSLLR